jgi:hypothetical protein
MMFDGKKNYTKIFNFHKIFKFLIKNSDDWETDPNFENKATEEEQRWGTGVDRGAAIKYDVKKSHN